MTEEPLQSKKEQAVRLFAENQKILRCPVCGKFLKMSPDGRLGCKKKHSFDITQKGYVNFAAAGALPGYDKSLFAARRAIFADGFYQPIADAVTQSVKEYAAGQTETVTILDAGCGEGYYTAQLCGDALLREKCRFWGIDLCRDAIAMAGQYHVPACWCVADLAKVPLGDGTVDVILDILTPANYAEFKRLLKRNGILIKVVPGSGYLREIREIVAPQLQNKSYSNQQVVDYTQAHMKLLSKKALSYQLPVSPEQAAAFLRMTPMTMHAQTDASLAAKLGELTIELEILIGRLP